MGFSDLGRKLSKLGQDTKNGVQKVSDSVSISNRISQEKKSLERLFAMIGEAVYKEHPDAPKEGLEDEWAAVKVAYANIASLTEQLNHVKGIVYCPNCGRPAASGDKFCAKCGFRLDIRPETTGAKVAKDLKEAGQEVGKIAGSAADRTGEAVGGAAAQTQNAFSWLKGKFRRTKKQENTPLLSDGASTDSAEETEEAEGKDGTGAFFSEGPEGTGAGIPKDTDENGAVSAFLEGTGTIRHALTGAGDTGENLTGAEDTGEALTDAGDTGYDLTGAGDTGDDLTDATAKIAQSRQKRQKNWMQNRQKKQR